MVYRPDPEKTDPKVLRRLALEEKIVEAIVDRLLEVGFELSVDDGGDEMAIERSRDKAAIMEALINTDEDRLHALVPRGGRMGNLRGGWVLFVYGNDGYDVVCDYTTGLEHRLKPVFDMVDRLERGQAA